MGNGICYSLFDLGDITGKVYLIIFTKYGNNPGMQRNDKTRSAPAHDAVDFHSGITCDLVRQKRLSFLREYFRQTIPANGKSVQYVDSEPFCQLADRASTGHVICN